MAFWRLSYDLSLYSRLCFIKSFILQTRFRRDAVFNGKLFFQTDFISWVVLFLLHPLIGRPTLIIWRLLSNAFSYLKKVRMRDRWCFRQTLMTLRTVWIGPYNWDTYEILFALEVGPHSESLICEREWSLWIAIIICPANILDGDCGCSHDCPSCNKPIS